MAIAPISKLPDFEIQMNGIISHAFLNNDIQTFHQACIFIQQLPYGRNADKTDLRTVFSDGQGTCSTKHAILKQLATENNFNDLVLTLGMFRMQESNTPAIGQTLAQYGLNYLPEAHMYLKYKDEYYDLTRVAASPNDFLHDLLFETIIQPKDVGANKIAIHQNYLTEWLQNNPDIDLSISEIWMIREQCIADLSNNG